MRWRHGMLLVLFVHLTAAQDPLPGPSKPAAPAPEAAPAPAPAIATPTAKAPTAPALAVATPTVTPPTVLSPTVPAPLPIPIPVPAPAPAAAASTPPAAPAAKAPAAKAPAALAPASVSAPVPAVATPTIKAPTSAVPVSVPVPAPAPAPSTAASAAGGIIPGPRDCFWRRGPYSADPYINIAYPDAGTFYWAAVFSMPPGATMFLEGQFPYSRYMSFISYNEKGAPVQSVADYLIKPSPGSSNPYITGADRTVIKRDYRLEVKAAVPDSNVPTGMSASTKAGTVTKLAAPKYKPDQQVILYRIYARDKGKDETGGTGLPKVLLRMADGTFLTGAEACKALNSGQMLAVDSSSQMVPIPQYQELLKAAAARGPTAPATSPPTWYIQLDRESLYNIYRGIPPSPDAARSVGGFYPNLDNQYLRTIVNRKLGKVLVIRAKAPTTPKTINGNKIMGSGDLRYWSFCSNQGFANTRVNDCVHDEQIPVDKNGMFTLVVSRAEDRPRNAVTQCGVAWLPMAKDGDGCCDEDVTVLQLRNMLGAGDFAFSIQAVQKPGEEQKAMGAYFPRGTYMTTAAFESIAPCLA